MSHRMITLSIAAGCLVSCGQSKSRYIVRNPPPASESDEKPPDLDLNLIIQEGCATSGCHGGDARFSSVDAMKATASLARIESGSMPIPNTAAAATFDAADKAALVAALKN